MSNVTVKLYTRLNKEIGKRRRVIGGVSKSTNFASNAIGTGNGQAKIAFANLFVSGRHIVSVDDSGWYFDDGDNLTLVEVLDMLRDAGCT